MPCNCRHGVGAHDHLGDAQIRDGVFGLGASINDSVDLAHIQSWNCQDDAAAVRRVFDPAHTANDIPIRSDGDPELLLYVPLASVCRVRGLSIVGPMTDHAPMDVQLFCNPVEMQGFDSVRRLRSQETLQLAQVAFEDRIVYRLNPGKFAAVSALAFYFEHSFDNEETHVLRIELFGESLGRPTTQQLATNVVYELRANPADHRTKEDAPQQFFSVQ